MVPHTFNDRLDDKFDQVVRACGDTGRKLAALRQNGCAFEGATAQDARVEDDDGNPVPETVITFTKRFESPTRAAVSSGR